MNTEKFESYGHTPQHAECMYTTIPNCLQYNAENAPTKEACVVYDSLGNRSSITNSELYKQALVFARGLMNLGILKGDLVALSLPNGPEWMICTFGIQLAGAIPLHFMFYQREGMDIADALAKTEQCTAIVFDPGENDVNLNISRHFIEYPENGTGIQSDIVKTLKHAILSKDCPSTSGVITIGKVLDIGRENPSMKAQSLGPDDSAAILLTSGSTGKPKPVHYSHSMLLQLGFNISESQHMKESDIYYSGNSFNWAAGYPHCYLSKGVTTVTCNNILQFIHIKDLNEFIYKAVSKEKCTVALISVPCISEMVKDATCDNTWARSLKTVTASGLPIPSSCSRVIGTIAEKFVILYGASECGMIAALTVSNNDVHEDFTVGYPVSGVEIKVLDGNGKTVPMNTVGELYVRHLVRPLGYYNDKTMTDKVFMSSGWYKTDDVGFMKTDNSFVVSGRKSDIMIVGGELVSPSYLENIIQKHPGVQQVVVVPISDKDMFQQACACVVPRPGYDLSEENLKTFLKEKFAIFPACRGLVPKYYLFFDSIPKSPLGKTSRYETKQMAIEQLSKME